MVTIMSLNVSNLPVNWFDFVFLLLLGIGLVRGRKRGMSEEVLDLVKWIVILVAAGHLYGPIGRFLADITVLGHLFCYIMVYLLIVLFFQALFLSVRRAIGQKLVTSDAFGRGEYYMGMMAGCVRYFCVVVVVLAVVNARLYSTEEVKHDEDFQEANYGSIRLPTLNRIQASVMANSLSGRMARKYLATYLIEPTAPENKPLGSSRWLRARERSLNEVLDKR